MLKSWTTSINTLSRFLTIVVFGCSVISCTENQTTNKQKSVSKTTEESLLKANRYLVRSEEENIQDFLVRYKWDMESTGTGLRYLIEPSGSGTKVQYGNLVTLSYTIRLLSGDIVKSSDREGLMKFTAGKGGVEAGLEEGIKMMRKGDKAKFILPSHLAFGLLGNGDNIPSKATLVYEIEITDIQ
ncbi:MAG: FKBP-type peptidyl-prolyl cis-trans isomerase [Bacteroidetes bacterium]|nr:MAG: FKBP-type peptidyl-prolyl cis-trans isomerase [Bacteroidota bacterium]